MKAPKNLEGIFVVASVLCGFAAFATADAPVTRSAPAMQVAAISVPAAITETQVVIVKAKRLTAAEKAALN